MYVLVSPGGIGHPVTPSALIPLELTDIESMSNLPIFRICVQLAEPMPMHARTLKISSDKIRLIGVDLPVTLQVVFDFDSQSVTPIWQRC